MPQTLPTITRCLKYVLGVHGTSHLNMVPYIGKNHIQTMMFKKDFFLSHCSGPDICFPGPWLFFPSWQPDRVGTPGEESFGHM